MKSKEEIEQLAEKSTIGVLPSHLDYRFIEVYKQFYIDGYNQCQEDMADKKYTEEDMKKAFKFYAYAHISQQPHSYEKLEQDYLQFIQSLNKQH